MDEKRNERFDGSGSALGLPALGDLQHLGLGWRLGVLGHRRVHVFHRIERGPRNQSQEGTAQNKNNKSHVMA